MIDEQKRLIFVENPKTATNTVKIALMGEDYLLNLLDPRMVTIGHETPAILQRRYPDQWQNYTSFVVVRNSWDRAYSFFNYYCKAGAESYRALSFDQWVANSCPPPDEDFLLAPMHGWGIFDNPLCQLRYVDGVDEVIVLHSYDPEYRHQELTDGLKRISRNLGFALETIPTDANHSSRMVKTEVWNQKTVDRIGELFAEEIAHFNFKPPVIKTRHQRIG